MAPEELSSSLEVMPALLPRVVAGLPEGDLRRRPAAGGFALVEQAWHLADLELEGYAARIERLLREDDPVLADFDGGAVARARRYLELDAVEGAHRFQQARAANLARLRGLASPALLRAGRQQGVGPVTLGDLPRMMGHHDRSHALEMASLLAEIAPAHPLLAEWVAELQGLDAG